MVRDTWGDFAGFEWWEVRRGVTEVGTAEMRQRVMQSGSQPENL